MFQSDTEVALGANKIALQAIDKTLNAMPGLLNRQFENLRKQTTSPRFRGLEDSLLQLHHKLDQLPRSLIDVSPAALAGSLHSSSLLPTGSFPITVEAPSTSLHALAKQLYLFQLKGLKSLPMDQSKRLLQAFRALLSSAKDAALSGLNVESILAIIDIARLVILQKPSEYRGSRYLRSC